MLKISRSERNPLNLYLESDNFDLLKEIKKYFTKKVPGYLFTPKYRAGVWNGDICLFDSIHKELPYGFLSDLLKIKKNWPEEEFIFDNDVKALFKGTDDEIIPDLLFKPRDYQAKCIKAAINYKKGIIKCATAGGKCAKDITITIRVPDNINFER